MRICSACSENPIGIRSTTGLCKSCYAFKYRNGMIVVEQKQRPVKRAPLICLKCKERPEVIKSEQLCMMCYQREYLRMDREVVTRVCACGARALVGLEVCGACRAQKRLAVAVAGRMAQRQRQGVKMPKTMFRTE